MSDDLVATTVRLPQAQLDALDGLSEAGEIPNRSEGIRGAIGFALDSDEWEGVSDDAKVLAAFKRTKRLSKVHFYREGFRPMVRRVLQAVGQTSPPWPPEAVERTAPKIFERQIDTLFETEERREWAWDVVHSEVEQYETAYQQEQPDDENPYVEAFEQEAPEGVIEQVYGAAEAEDLVPEAIRMLDGGEDPIIAAEKLSRRSGIDSDTAVEAVEQATAESGAIEADEAPALTDGGEADD